MSAYIEVMVRGDARALVEAGNVGGILMSPGMTASDPATPEAPLSILLRNGATVEGVYGISPNRLLMHVEGAKILMRERGRPMLVAYLDEIDAFEAEIAASLERGRE